MPDQPKPPCADPRLGRLAIREQYRAGQQRGWTDTITSTSATPLPINTSAGAGSPCLCVRRAIPALRLRGVTVESIRIEN